jgi:predicted O-methyltransferase YrrM
MTRTEIIQKFINQINAKKYLEIGMGSGINFHTIECDYKVCVDPTPTEPVTYTLTSDDFFIQNNETFDVVFIDGLHMSEQVYLDILN